MKQGRRIASRNKSFHSLVFVLTQLHSVEQSSILSAKFGCPMACQNVPLLTTAHDCEIDLLHCNVPWDEWNTVGMLARFTPKLIIQILPTIEEEND